MMGCPVVLPRLSRREIMTGKVLGYTCSSSTSHGKRIFGDTSWDNGNGKPPVPNSNQSFGEKRFCHTLSHQTKLPKLPVPKLIDTLPKYLKSVRPFLTPEEYQVTFQNVKDFAKAGGVGHSLQQILEERYAIRENWFSTWWMEMAYLGYRDPVTVWSSPGVVWPRRKWSSEEEMLQFAARVVFGALDYKLMLDKGTLPVEKQGGKPLDMEQHYKIFGTCRLPRKPLDILTFHPDSRHIMVLYRKNQYKMEVYGEFGDLLSYSQILGSLKHIIALDDQPGPGVGVLTSGDRDTWADRYSLLNKGKNSLILSDIESSLFTLSLDPDLSSSVTGASPLSVSALVALHGGSASHACQNRWHDKTLQFIVTQSGECGLTYEHSPAEGGPVMQLSDHILDCAEGRREYAGSNLLAVRYKNPVKLDWKLNPILVSAIDSAIVDLKKLTSLVDIHVLHFTQFGKTEIKRLGFSPDSFIQIAIQVSFYRIHGSPGAQYESGATRLFRKGRTEVIRTCSIESTGFSEAVVNNARSGEKFKLMKMAITAHNTYARAAVQGLGVDRHLQGLKRVAVDQDIPMPSIFTDEGYLRSSRMRISTSQVSGRNGSFLCFPPLTEDGYGCCYNIRPDDIFLSCSALNTCPDTSATVFRNTLEETLLEMHKLANSHIQSKL